MQCFKKFNFGKIIFRHTFSTKFKRQGKFFLKYWLHPFTENMYDYKIKQYHQFYNAHKERSNIIIQQAPCIIVEGQVGFILFDGGNSMYFERLTFHSVHEVCPPQQTVFLMLMRDFTLYHILFNAFCLFNFICFLILNYFSC